MVFFDKFCTCPVDVLQLIRFKMLCSPFLIIISPYPTNVVFMLIRIHKHPLNLKKVQLLVMYLTFIIIWKNIVAGLDNIYLKPVFWVWKLNYTTAYNTWWGMRSVIYPQTPKVGFKWKFPKWKYFKSYWLYSRLK